MHPRINLLANQVLYVAYQLKKPASASTLSPKVIVIRKETIDALACLGLCAEPETNVCDHRHSLLSKI
jgi:hypothetical protein